MLFLRVASRALCTSRFSKYSHPGSISFAEAGHAHQGSLLPVLGPDSAREHAASMGVCHVWAYRHAHKILQLLWHVSNRFDVAGKWVMHSSVAGRCRWRPWKDTTSATESQEPISGRIGIVQWVQVTQSIVCHSWYRPADQHNMWPETRITSTGPTSWSTHSAHII